jgi:tetratricopeptide (TPR) repeat protein
MSRLFGAKYFDLASVTLVFMCLLSSAGLHAQSVSAQEPSAALQGIVRDSHGHPLDGAKVSLMANDAVTLTVNTHGDGAYRFSSMRPGEYVLRAEKIGYVNATLGPFAVAQNESRTVDLTLASAKASQKSADASPAFFDEPHFTVAGVTDTTNLGGHGSDTVVRNREALAKATASLSNTPSASPPLSPANTAAEKRLRETLARQPADFDANYQLGKLLVDGGKAAEGLVYLERASQLNPADYDNSYELALALANTGDYQRARANILALMNSSKFVDKAEPHHLLAEVSEKLNQPLQAVREYQRAADLNPIEPYFFDWGAELLLHHAAEPAVEVFTNAHRLFPRSARILAALGASWYALGSYEKAVQRLCEASDLNPDDPSPYLFLGKLQAVETTSSTAIAERLKRLVMLQPDNASANYYYAISVWKARQSPEDAETFVQVKSLLEKSIHLDPTFGPAYLQLGILYSERKDFSNAVAAYQNAIQATPDIEEVHYRLAQVYRQTGQTLKAQAELQRYEEISREKAAEVDRQRHEVQQFVYELRDPESHTKSQ